VVVETRNAGVIDIQAVLDEGPWPALSILVVALAALSIMLDGFDSQLIGFAIPVIMRDWGAARADFTPVVAAGLIGMCIGSATTGIVADRFGRRVAIVGSLITFGVATALIGAAQDLQAIGALRFVAGLGIGGALPSATTMAAEFTPKWIRAVAITATIVCVPLGGMVAGVFAGALLPQFGWRILFVLGGAMPLCLSLALMAFLPESPRWLAARTIRATDLADLLKRMARPVAQGSAFVDSGDLGSSKGGLASLFQDGRSVSTVLLWITFFLTLLAVYAAFSWLPTMLVGEGLSVAQSGSGLTAYNIGGVVGALACALVVSRIGSRWPLAFCCLGGAVSALLLSRVKLASHFELMLVGIGIHGLFVNAVQSVLFAVTANVYPTSARATGTAIALSFGRFGAILSAFVGAAVISAGGSGAYLLSISIAMFGAMVALTVLPRHIPARSSMTTKTTHN
jgi:AAHS family 4-hydroxybenzoate transporter-like MFS transporter